MSSTTTRSQIGSEDINHFDGTTDTFVRQTSTGGSLTLKKVGYEVDVAEAYGAGTVSGTALIAAVAAIGTTNKRTIVLRHGTWNLNTSLTIPSNITTKILHGAVINVATTKTLTINGPIEAGPWQIFSWGGTGAISLGGSPTLEIPLEWFGGVALKTTDNGPILTKAISSRGPSQWITLHVGEYGILTPTTTTDSLNGLRVKGMGKNLSRLYINTPAAVGWTIGVGAGTDGYNLDLIDFSVVSNENPACTNAIKILEWHRSNFDLNFMVGGATDYALDIQGCLWMRGRLEFGHFYGNWPSYYWLGGATPTTNHPSALHIKPTATGYQSNAIDLDVIISQRYFNVGVNLNAGTSGPDVARITGSIEDCVDPLLADGYYSLNLDTIYMIDSNTNGPTITNCINTHIKNVYADFSTVPVTKLINCRGTVIDGLYCGQLNIDGNCRGTVVKNLFSQLTPVDAAPDTVYEGCNLYRSGWELQVFPAQAPDRRNLLTNFYFDRWTATAPDGWVVSNITATKETGTIHLTTNCLKTVATADSAYTEYILNASQLNAVKGKVANFTIWANIAAAQTFSTYPYVWMSWTPPARANTTAYTVGQGISSGGNTYICYTTGTSAGAPPVFDTTQGNLTTDGTVVWKRAIDQYASGATSPLGAGNIGGGFTKMAVGGYIPSNVTSVQLWLSQPRQTGPANSTMYWSEPCLMVGWQGPTSLVQGQDEFESSIKMGVNRVYFGTAAPAVASTWYNQGDVCFRSDATSGQAAGWMCTVSGVAGAATWVAMANLA